MSTYIMVQAGSSLILGERVTDNVAVDPWILPGVSVPEDVLSNDFFYAYEFIPESITLTTVPRSRPTGQTWDTAGRTGGQGWEDNRDLVEAKRQAWRRLEVAMEESEVDREFTHLGKTYVASPFFKEFILAIVLKHREMGSEPPLVDIPDIDGVFSSFTKEEIEALYTDISNLIMLDYERAKELKDHIDTLTTNADIDAVDWDTVIP